MIELMQMILLFAMIAAGFFTLMAGLLWLIWWAIGKIIKLLGYWKYFIRALGIAAKQINDERRAKRKQ